MVCSRISRDRKEIKKMISELFIGLLVGAGAVCVLVLSGFGFSIKKIKKIKS